MAIDTRNISMMVNINIVTVIEMMTNMIWIVNITQTIIHINPVLIKRTRLIREYIVTRTIIPMVQTILHINLIITTVMIAIQMMKNTAITMAIQRNVLIRELFITKTIKKLFI